MAAVFNRHASQLPTTNKHYENQNHRPHHRIPHLRPRRGKSIPPNNGRIIDTVTPHAEFLATPDKTIEIRFLDDTGKAIAPADQAVTVIMGDRAAPTKLAFAKDGDKLVSDKTIPEGKELPVVLQIKSAPDAKSVTEKFNLNLATYPECKLLEYACTCDHPN